MVPFPLATAEDPVCGQGAGVGSTLEASGALPAAVIPGLDGDEP
jgi:hypothetical protein